MLLLPTSGFSGDRGSISLGRKFCYVGDDWNDSISSIACADRCRLEAWEHRDYQGAMKVFAGGYASQYVGDDWNDRISSMRVVCDLESTNSSDCSSGPATCTQGFVWREARPGDLVCVKPEVRTLAAPQNRLAAERRAGGGPYGENTCKGGFVWREAFDGDPVCVPPPERDQARQDNGRAGIRLACRR